MDSGVMRVGRGGSGARRLRDLAARPVKGGDSKGDTPMSHWSLLYQAQDSS